MRELNPAHAQFAESWEQTSQAIDPSAGIWRCEYRSIPPCTFGESFSHSNHHPHFLRVSEAVPEFFSVKKLLCNLRESEWPYGSSR